MEKRANLEHFIPFKNVSSFKLFISLLIGCDSASEQVAIPICRNYNVADSVLQLICFIPVPKYSKEQNKSALVGGEGKTS